VAEAGDGECIGVELSCKVPPKRGDVLMEESSASTDKTVSVHAFWASAEPLRPGQELVVECRTQSVVFEVISVADELEQAGTKLTELAGGDVGQVVLKSRGPVLVESEPEGTPMSRLVFHRNGQMAGCGVVAHAA
jgi:sulfate adenylyltransferase subunit 1 (EFTu-like GTPase family)